MDTNKMNSLRSHEFTDAGTLYLRSDEFTDAGVMVLAKLCRNLTVADLEACKQLTDASVTALATHCPNLTCISLDFSHSVLLTESAVITIAKSCRNATTIRLTACPKITAMTLDAIIPASAPLFPNLENLDLSWCDACDTVVATLVTGCPNLMSIDLHNAFMISDVALTAIAKSCPKLKDIVTL